MNRSQPFGSPVRFFGPAIQFISSAFPSSRDAHGSSSSRPTTSASRTRELSIDDDDPTYTRLDALSSATMQGGDLRSVSPRPHRRGSSGELALTPTRSIPLISLSRSPSPYPRSRSAAQSEDEDDDYDVPISLRPLIHGEGGGAGSSRRRDGIRGWKSIFQEGGLGRFFFGTWTGYQVYVGLLVFWVGGCTFGLLLMDRFIILTGTYKVSYPVTIAWLQLFITHLLMLAWASLTRTFPRTLQKLGLRGLVAPSQARPSSSGGFRGGSNSKEVARGFGVLFKTGVSGIAGGGLFEFDKKVALQMLPLVLIFLGQMLLSITSFAYTQLPLFVLCRIGVIPLTLIFTSYRSRTNQSVSTLSAALITTFNLLMASVRSGIPAVPEGVVTGVFSNLFIALYPIALLRTYRSITTSLVPQGDLLTDFLEDTDQGEVSFPVPTTEQADGTTSREESRAYYMTLHYTSLLSLLILGPIIIFSGELSDMLKVCVFLDVPWFWFMMLCGGVFHFLSFMPFLLLLKATSPLAANFTAIPVQALQLSILAEKMPVHAWVGEVLCWLGCAWFALVRRSEGRRWAVGVGTGLGVGR